MEVKRYVAKVGEREVIIETGKFAGQAGGAVTVRCGDSVLLATATAAKEPREGIDFFPLSVEFEERLYAAGRIPGSFFRREGKPTEQAILQARLIDRSIRPLFPKDFRNEVQVIVTALSSDEENPLDILGMIGASAALTISDIPWEGPIGAVRVGYVNGQFVFNPTLSELEQSLLDIRLAGSEDAIIMVEAGAKEAPEELVLQALEAGHRAMQELIRVQHQMREEVGKPKVAYEPVQMDEALAERVRAMATEPIKQVLLEKDDKHGRREALDALLESIVEQLTQELGEENLDLNTVKTTFDDIVKAEVRRAILEEQRRPDGRKPNELRPLYCEVGLLPRTHGSGLFVRGETQVLTIATLGTTAEEQKLDSLDSEETKRYIHHYNFPPFSVGEVRPLRGPGRREIGHGALAERALVPVLPSEEDFPYTIRLVSEVLSSNGSSSMASVCGSTLALMDAGVPIKRPVAGVAMGLITDGQRYVILTDIQGLEDHEGDMDFKVAGTREGITALQMDIKVKGISSQILSEALAQAREARLQILDFMAQTISEPRPELSPYAPRIIKLTIDPAKIGMLIGPGGKVVRKIQEDAKVEIQIEEDGTVYIAARADSKPDLAVQMVEQITEEIQVGKIYTGKVVRITDFGAFVEILPGQDGLVHISQLADYRVPRVEDVVHVGDEVMVMVTDIDSEGRVRLSRRAVMEGWTPEEARMHDRPPAPNKGEGGRPRSESSRPPRSGGERGGGERSVPSGPRRRGR